MKHHVLVVVLAGTVAAGFAQDNRVKQAVAKDKPEPAVDCSQAKPGNPICYAQEIQRMLEEYVVKQEKEVAERRAQYDRTAVQFDRDKRWQIDSGLAAERDRKADWMAKALIAGKVEPWDWRTPLQQYMVEDYQRTRVLLGSDLQNGVSDGFVTSIENLQAEVAKAKKLSDLIKHLATPRDLKDELEQWMAFGKETKDEYQKLACTAAAEKKKAVVATKGKKEAELADAKKKAPPDLSQIEKVTAEVAVLKDQESGLTAYATQKNCSTK